ncbi:MAG: hypothetical protein JOZ41_22745, partial [Chloroflexi bacterium]|nr:hypothetical protein [Chloroflexota bacterium]
GQYRGAFAARTQGSYVVSVEARGAGHASTGQAGLDVPYSAEFRTTGADLPLLRDLARAGGGTVIARPESVWADNVSPVYDQRSLTDVLWLIALLLLPVDIALRRLLLRRRDLAALWDAVRSPRSREPAPAARPAWAEGGAAWSAAQSLDAPAGEGTGGRRRAGAATAERADALPGLRTGKRPATARRPATAAEATVGQLLASKRRRS